VLGLYYSGQLGRRDEARAMLAEAERLLAAPPAGAAGDATWRHAVGRLRFHQGFAALNDGQLQRASVLLAEADAALADAVRLRPADPEPLAELWETRLNRADTLAAGDRHAAAERLLRAELAAAPARLRSLGGHAKAPLLLARTEGMLGNARYYQGDVAGALAAYQRQVAVLEAEDARRPGRSRTLAELMKAWWNEATTLDELGRRAGALALLDRALAAGQARLALDGDHEGLHRVTALVATERAGMLARAGRGAQAVAEAESALAERRARAAAKPNDPVLALDVLSSLRPLGEIKAAIGRPAEACAEYRAAADGFAAFQRRWPLSPIYNTELTLVREKLAACAG
jgi:tetratricopeptide (TPR) repeat protein